MDMKFTDSELKVMEVLWEMGEGNALDMVNILMERLAGAAFGAGHQR